jgi:hypothetical protein
VVSSLNAAVSLPAARQCADDDDEGGGLDRLLKCRCLPSCRSRHQGKFSLLLLLALAGGFFYEQQQEADWLTQLEEERALAESYEVSAT